MYRPSVSRRAPRRSRALAQREGGIVHLRHEPREAGIGRQPIHNALAEVLVKDYMRGQNASASAGHLGHALEHLGHAYTHNPVARNPLVGRKGLLGAVEDLVKSTDPIALEQTLAKAVRHPLYTRSATGLNAGIVVGGPGGFRLGKIELPKEAAPEDVVAKSLGSARRKYAEQKGLRREELSRRVGQAAAAQEEAGGGLAGHRASLRQLKGELPRVQFEKLRKGNLSQADFEKIVRHAQDHPDLQFFEQLNAVEALRKAYSEGKVPTPSEVKLLQTAFGQDAAAAVAHVSRLKKLGHIAVDAIGIPRSLMASVDLSAPFRQGLVAGARHPKLFAKNFGPMVKSFGSEHVYQSVLADIHERPTYPLMEEAGVKFTELGRDLVKHEEQFPSHLAEKIPVVHGSARAYTAFLDKMRADMFDEHLRLAKKAGVNIEDRAQLRGIARLVNNATGRGDLGKIESWAPAANAIFFSPRLIASRVNMLNPIWYATLPRYARGQAIRSMVQLGASAGLVLGAGVYFGGRVGKDPRSADFAKLRIANTRFDVLGGFQQYMRLGAQEYTGKIISSTSGKTLTLGPGIGNLSRWDIAERFAVGKFSPPPSFIHDFATGTDFQGQPFSVKKAVLSRTIPLVVQDAWDTYHNYHSVQLALLGYSISAFGIGTQTYGPKPPKGKAPSNPFLGAVAQKTKAKSSSSNPYLPGSSSGSSSNPFMP